MIYLRVGVNGVDICENKEFFPSLHCQDDKKTVYDESIRGRISCDIPRVIKYGRELSSSRKMFFEEFSNIYCIKLLLLILAEK